MTQALMFLPHLIIGSILCVCFIRIGRSHPSQRCYYWLAAGSAWSTARAIGLEELPIDSGAIPASTLPRVALMTLGSLLCWKGLVEHFRLPRPLAQRVLQAVLFSWCLYALLLLSAWQDGRPVSVDVMIAHTVLNQLAIGGLALWASMRERQAGHLGFLASQTATAVLVFFTLSSHLGHTDAGLLLLLAHACLQACVFHTCLLRERTTLQQALEREAVHIATLDRVLSSQEATIQEQTAVLRKSLQEVTGADKAKSNFVATLSHEIRTPLSGLTMVIDMLTHTPLTGEQRELTDTAKRAARQLKRLLDDVLDVSKLEAGMLTIQVEPFELREFLIDTVEVYRTLAQKRNLSFNVQVQSEDAMLVGDVHRIAQILRNLLDNAFKFTSKGSIDLLAQVKRTDADHGRHLIVTVRDTGPGIPPDKQATVFERFLQQDAGVASRHGGSGLGLHLSRQLCELMGGDLSLTSVPGRGSSFTMRISCESGDVTSCFADTEPMLMPVNCSLQGRKVLVADDNAVNLKLMQRMLESEGMQVLVARDGPTAVELALSRSVDIVLMDVSMPGMNGWQATRDLRTRALSLPKPERERVMAMPVIGVTAMVGESNRRRCVESGMADFIPKPVERRVLLETIRRTIPCDKLLRQEVDHLVEHRPWNQLPGLSAES